MDISDTLAPNSDQLDAVDLLGGPRVFTIESVSKGTAEQPVQVHLKEFPRPWRPGKSMRRVLGARNTWGTDAARWVGRQVELWCDPSVRFGGAEVGGIRVLKMSHIDGPQKIPLLLTRGKSATYTVHPLAAPEPTQGEPRPIDLAAQVVAALAEAGTEDDVRLWEGRAKSRDLLDVEIDGTPVRVHVERRLAAVVEGGEQS